MNNTYSKGMTLIELMVVVGIVGILAGIAYPSYRDSVMRSSRTSAKTALTTTAQDLERCYTRLNAYNIFTLTGGVADCAAAYQFNGGTTFNTSDGKYQISAPTLSATAFTLQATPLGGQANDSRCMNLTLDNVDTKTKSGTGTLSDCW